LDSVSRLTPMLSTGAPRPINITLFAHRALNLLSKGLQ
jgi:hypothetical protein